MNGDEPIKLKSPEEKGAETVSSGALEEINFSPLIDYFGMERPSLEETNMLRDLYQMLGTNDKTEMLTKLKEVEQRIGFPPTGERRIPRVIRYIQLDQEINNLLKEQRTIIR